ncbi:MAG TPA: aquaporin [Gemmatimonadales bacterium]|nr:aquaporin [Gemmatimonadales bacterium]
MSSLLRRCTAEAIGTFALVFIGAGSIMSGYFPKSDFGVFGVALAHGLILATMVTATMRISGGHLNPAITLGLLVARRTNVQTAVAYILTQVVAAIAAAAVLKALYPPAVLRATALGTPHLAASVSLTQGIALEAIMAFFLVSAVFGTCVHPEAPRVGGFAIGLTLAADIMMGGGLTGAAVNPARAFGPALVAGDLVAQAVYWVGPLLGGVAAGLLWEHVLLPKRTAA